MEKQHHHCVPRKSKFWRNNKDKRKNDRRNLVDLPVEEHADLHLMFGNMRPEQLLFTAVAALIRKFEDDIGFEYIQDDEIIALIQKIDASPRRFYMPHEGKNGKREEAFRRMFSVPGRRRRRVMNAQELVECCIRRFFPTKSFYIHHIKDPNVKTLFLRHGRGG